MKTRVEGSLPVRETELKRSPTFPLHPSRLPGEEFLLQTPSWPKKAGSRGFFPLNLGWRDGPHPSSCLTAALVKVRFRPLHHS